MLVGAIHSVNVKSFGRAFKSTQDIDAPQKKHSMLGWALTGGLGGYAVKEVAPISAQEKKGHDMLGFIKTQKPFIVQSKSEAIEEIAQNLKNTPNTKNTAAELFVDLSRKKGLTYAQAKARLNEASQDTKTGVLNLLKKVNDSARNVRQVSAEVTSILIKKVRPTWVFAGGMAIAGAASAFVLNSFNNSDASA